MNVLLDISTHTYTLKSMSFRKSELLLIGKYTIACISVCKATRIST